MKIGVVILIIVLILALVLGSSFVTRRNQMAIKREAVNAAWSQVDVVLQRRADLIPNLVETVKGYAVQEQVVLWRNRQGPLGVAERHHACGQDRRQRPVGFRAGPLVGHRRKLSAAQIQREFHASAG